MTKMNDKNKKKDETKDEPKLPDEDTVEMMYIQNSESAKDYPLKIRNLERDDDKD